MKAIPGGITDEKKQMTSRNNSTRRPKYYNEKRIRKRFATRNLSQILFKKKSIGCLIENISSNGALLKVSTARIPDKFILANFISGKKMACKVVWRDQNLVGVRFVTKPRPFAIDIEN